MKKIHLLAVISAMVALSACSKLTAENYAKVENGMTETQVIEILGKPTTMESGSFLGISGSSYVYQQGDKTIRISFVNGKVMTKEGKL